jgi:quercetin dioxygenase-like cupin family protein
MSTMIASDPGCLIVAPGEGEQIRIFDEEVSVKVTGLDTAGVYALATISVAPGGGPPLHAHAGNETFYVVSGEFEFTQRDASGISTSRGGAGTVVHAPGGAAHRFENVGAERGTLLFVVAPDAIEFLRDLGAAFPPGAEPDMEKMLAIHEKFGVVTVYGAEGSRPEPPKDGATSARARALAWRFQQAHEALCAAIERCTPEQWRAVCADTGWPVGTQAHHIAVNEATIADVILSAAKGRPHAPKTNAELDEINTRHAQAFAHVAQAETVELLRRNGEWAARGYRLLTDDQLALSVTTLVGAESKTVAQLIEDLAIGEIAGHWSYIQKALAG